MKCKRHAWLNALKLAASLILMVPVLLQQAACSCENYGSIVVTRNVDYLAGSDYAEDKDKLDIFMPEDSTSAAVIVFFHGGALQHGDKSHGEVLAMRSAGNCDIRVVEIPNRDHTSLMTQMNTSDDQIGGFVLSFIKGWEGNVLQD